MSPTLRSNRQVRRLGSAGKRGVEAGDVALRVAARRPDEAEPRPVPAALRTRQPST